MVITAPAPGQAFHVARFRRWSAPRPPDRRIAAELVQAAAAGRPGADDRDAQPGADLGVRHGRLVDEQGKQPLAARGQAAECLTQRRVTFRCKALLFGRPGLVAGFPPGAGEFPGNLQSIRAGRTFAHSRRAVTASQRAGILDFIQVARELSVTIDVPQPSE
jgi:hypothetical protein